MFHRSIVGLGLFIGVAAPVSAQHAGREPAPPGIRTLLSLDSAHIRNANVSPDGKWLVFALDSSGGVTSSIWIAAMGDRKPVRITSEGYTDRWPTVSPAGDRVFFLSNRPGRDARSRATYVVSIPIDRGTGRPTGPVRQVTTDSVTFLPANGISADGKWLAYTIAGKPPELRLIPSVGGNARTLVSKFTYGGLYTGFTPDGKRVVFQDSLTHLIMEVPVSGGPATVVRRTTDGEQQAPVPNADGRVIVGKDATGAYALLDVNGRTLGTTQIPPSFGTAKIPRGDGLGWIGVSNDLWYGIKRVDLGTGAISEVLSARPGEPLGVTSDGSILTHRIVNGRRILTTVASTGRAVREITLAPEITSLTTLIPGGTHILARGNILPHEPAKDARGIDTTRRLFPAYLIDRTTGVVRKVADSVFSTEGGSGIGVIHGTMMDVKSIGADGAARLVRSFPSTEYHRFDDASISGTRVAWADATGKQEVVIYLATGPTTPPVRLGVIERSDTDDVGTTLAWSSDGHKLAAVFNDPRNRSRLTALVFDLADNGSLAHTSPLLDLGAHAEDVETVSWLPDGSALLVYRDDPSVKSDPYYVTLRSLDPTRPPVHLAPGAGEVYDVLIEPGSKSVLLEFSHDGGASIWTADYVPVKKP